MNILRNLLKSENVGTFGIDFCAMVNKSLETMDDLSELKAIKDWKLEVIRSASKLLKEFPIKANINGI